LFNIGCSQPECRQPLGGDVLGVSTDLRNGPQQQLVTPHLGIVGDDLDDFEAVVDPKLLVFPIMVDGEQGIALIGAENQLTGGRLWYRAGGFRRRMAIRSGGLNRNHRLGWCDQRGWHLSDQPWKEVTTFIVWPSPR
jgi:hypothetical protein